MLNKIKTSMKLLLLLAFIHTSCDADQIIYHEKVIDDRVIDLDLPFTVPIGVNSWVVNSIEQDEAIISDAGIHNWTSLDDVIRTYVYTQAGELNLGFNIKSDKYSEIKVTVGNQTEERGISNSDYDIVGVGTFNVEAGYNIIEIQGLQKNGNYIADINDILLGGSATANGIKFVPLSNPHFGRRGPSVHMTYTPPENKDVQWFYNEVTVAPGEDVLGSFFMVNGHSEGYFGMQVNSNGERRVLFSIWSAFETDDPNQIPEDYQVTKLANGQGVTVQDFGNEGSGKQSFFDADWKAGVTYKFLLKGEPSTVSGSTDYTAYFFDPEVGSWKLIASLRRPKTSKYLTRMHSFLENFHESTGYIERQVEYGNQWVYTTDNVWTEMIEGTYTADATAANDERLDYAGGANGDKFYLRNCGFFNDAVQPNASFTRTASGTAPDIDFSSLPQITLPTDVTLFDRSAWSVVDYSSQEDQGGEGSTGLASDVLDGDLDTYWHTCWNGCTPTPPHHITIDMGSENTVDGLRFTQRQTLSRTIKSIEIEVSNDNTNWISLGSFVLANSADNQYIDFSSSQTFRYLKFIAKDAHDGSDNAAMAEIEAYTKN